MGFFTRNKVLSCNFIFNIVTNFCQVRGAEPVKLLANEKRMRGKIIMAATPRVHLKQIPWRSGLKPYHWQKETSRGIKGNHACQYFFVRIVIIKKHWSWILRKTEAGRKKNKPENLASVLMNIRSCIYAQQEEEYTKGLGIMQSWFDYPGKRMEVLKYNIALNTGDTDRAG